MALPSRPKLPITVEKPTPYTFDLGLLLATDPNPTELDRSDPQRLEASLAQIARDGAQALVNQLLTTCPVTTTAAGTAAGGGVLLTLPPAQTPLPREKPVPQPRPPTKWELFARRKGIRPKTREQRRNLRFNEASGEWEKKWGFRAQKKTGADGAAVVQDDWLVELDDKDAGGKKSNKEGGGGEGATTGRGESRRERKERAKRNERRMRRNERNAGKK